MVQRTYNMQLTITQQEWVKGDQFPESVNWKNTQKLSFKKYTDIANYLDSHVELKNKVMLVKSHNQVMGSKVIFDGVDTFIEGRGHV